MKNNCIIALIIGIFTLSTFAQNEPLLPRALYELEGISEFQSDMLRRLMHMSYMLSDAVSRQSECTYEDQNNCNMSNSKQEKQIRMLNEISSIIDRLEDLEHERKALQDEIIHQYLSESSETCQFQNQWDAPKP